MDAAALSSDAFQALMRHKSYMAKKRKINTDPRMDKAIESLPVPNVRRNRTVEKQVGKAD